MALSPELKKACAKCLKSKGFCTYVLGDIRYRCPYLRALNPDGTIRKV